MEEKWFAYFDHGWLHLHRSWTGFEMYKAEIVLTGGSYVINSFCTERNTEKYANTNDEVDIQTFCFLIARMLLQIYVSKLKTKQVLKEEIGIIDVWSRYGNLILKAPQRNIANKIKSALFGVTVGDALGVPHEFSRPEDLRENPVTDMVGYGAYDLPPGTWSDDSSLTFCLAESLCSGYNTDHMGELFVKWYYQDNWTATCEVFDIGIGARNAFYKIKNGTKAEFAGGQDEKDNGNGSLMRILPLVFAIQNLPIEERFERTRQVSSITHGHIRAVMACFYYLEFAKQLIEGKSKFEIYKDLQISIPSFFEKIGITSSEIAYFDCLLKANIADLPLTEIRSGGYVIETIEASIWCLLTTDNYKDAVLKAVNLGHDTDTTAAVTGGLAGLLYGFDGIPNEWVKKLARVGEIERLAMEFTKYIDDNKSV
jgi:ADP-ribosylglycohydrolase